jgi:hypothetical protein
MDENTKYIVASNLTAAYFAAMEPQLQPASNDPARTEREMARPFNEIVAVYLGFIETFEERGTLGPVS